MTAIGMHAETVYRDRAIADENIALKAELAHWAEATPAQKIDPKLVGPSKWANRHEKSFSGREWDAFKEEILSAGGNIQPIRVRSVPPGNTSTEGLAQEGVPRGNTLPLTFEIVFGHRRHRACLELGLPVFALISQATDRELFEQMDRENRQRADLTIYEQGEMYRRALDDGLYSSLRKLSESLGVGLGIASESVSIAKLPGQILDVFESRLDIQRRWAGALAGAVQKDPDRVFAVAKGIQAERTKGRVVKSVDVFKRLTAAQGVAVGRDKNSALDIAGKSGRSGKFLYDEKRQSLRLELSGIDPDLSEKLKSAISKLIG